MAIPQEITDLIIRFENDSAFFLHSEYKEAKLRIQFIDPFFRSLGWDFENKRTGDDRDCVVNVAESIRFKGTKKEMDYSFEKGNKILFVVETKKPSVPIKDNAKAAFQLRGYGWNANASLCILTNFREFAVYDCTSRPAPEDNASYALKEFFTFKDLPEKWDWINTIFGKASAYAEIERYIESTRGKKKTISVDDAILSDIEQWRDTLARNIALRNPKTLTDTQLNSVVQQTIDRILFLRICEDRGIEEENTLLHLTESDNIYDQLQKIYRSADIKYNSGLFHFREESGWNEAPDTLSTSVILDDKVLKEIIKDLYEPRSIYRWDIISPAILGQVYEQFLGKVIRLTEGGKAKIEFKPEVKKAGGVFYTPEFIVDYIVKNTVGELIKGKTPREVAKLRILDPACGSGSFLIGAYQYLIDWHLSWYKENLVPVYLKKGSHTDPEISALLPEPIPKKKIRGTLDADKFPIYRSRSNATLSGDSNNWKLKTTEKKRILLNNIYGVDIDKQAVEVTKLSLLLKVLEDENSQNITTQLKLFEEQALPHLDQNIKCGNSLIGWDIQTPEMPNDELNRIKPFDWEREYAEVMKAGGFDAVIGNPPYVRQETLKEQKKYFETHYAVYQGTADLYAYFIERGISLLRPKGLFSFIVANKWLRTNFGRQLRNFLLTKQIEEIIDFGDLPVFKTATTYPCIIRVSNEKPVREFCASKVEALDFPSLEEYVMANWHSIDPSTLTDNGWTLGDKGTEKFLKKLQSVGISLVSSQLSSVG